MINASDSNGTFYILNQNQGIPIIFIHGVGLNHKIWKPQFMRSNRSTMRGTDVAHPVVSENMYI